MTARHCIMQLLALGGLTLGEMYVITGWPRARVRQVVGGLVDCGLVWRNGPRGKGVYTL